MTNDLSPDLDLRPARTPSIRRIAAIVNEAGGGVGAGAADELRRIVANFSPGADVVSVGPGEIAGALRAAVDKNPDLLITLAGDGTARLAAELCGADGPLFAPLAGGTMNMLPYALYGRHSWQDALDGALRAGVVRPTPGGSVAGRPFYVAAILGAPALWAPAREAVRHGKLMLALTRARRALALAFKSKLRFELDGVPQSKAEAVAFVSPLMTEACAGEAFMEAVALDPRHAVDAFRIGFASLFGDWRSDPAVRSHCCKAAHITARQAIPCLLDGELCRLDHDVEVAFVPNAFYALVGPDAPLPDAAADAKL
ncbi:diacylglycerol kinase catalytic region [Methylocella silvestris BL2]|uniref:Diacylglycerol kinase catalytic region n=1 Tax=Methylocella silvestris (strain DSM 15510 / CIP 108128 / LMG 27833 / NCIMB 13906 / BL2) TaxID=395965 RepID=B8EIE6_METSB|nr:diacylglycerol kinase family protein [Methylocella silvestris]ACK51265.1 diacylglycerol kinase catalytic region [Methylocella silvestris BL2]